MRRTAGFNSSQVEVDSEVDESSSSSSDEDEDACELTEEVEKNFFRALSCLKKKDPQIYDADARFFKKVPEIDENVIKEKRKNKTETPLTLREYERNILQNRELLEGEDSSVKERKKTFVEEQKELKESFKKVLVSDSDDEDGEEIGGLFREHSKSKAEKKKEEEDFRQWLKGQRNELDDKVAEGDMKYLHDYWNDPNLDEKEKFLRDYILNKRFLDKDENYEENPDKFVTLEEDENILSNQVEFEHKYNFRFEEPDHEFIKRYPRVMERSMRQKDKKRKLKREAVKVRKIEEKTKKMKDLRKLQTAKRKEIEERIRQIKEATGNEELGFKDEDIEKDFDPNEHDVQMQKLFNEEFYNFGESDKPVFTENLDLDQYNGEEEEDYYSQETGNNYEESYFENDDFIMDCDYTPEKAALAKQKKLEARANKKNKRKMVSATESIMLNQNTVKPVFDANLHKTFQNYLDEYYSLDCEDFIDDMPCRFKYKEVVPNSYGLTIEEILAADDKELNKWCPMQKISQKRPIKEELYEVKVYKQKAVNEDLKKKIFPSLYKSDENGENEDNSVKKKKKKKKKRKNKINLSGQDLVQLEDSKVEDINESQKIYKTNKRKHECTDGDPIKNISDVAMVDHKKKKLKTSEETVYNDPETSIKSVSEVDDNKKKKKHKKNYTSTESETVNSNQNDTDLSSDKLLDVGKSMNVTQKIKNNKFLQKKSNDNFSSVNQKEKHSVNKSKQFNSKNSPKSSNSSRKQNSSLEMFYKDISDSRLKAYGIKPKRFKNKLKYGNTK